jgi:phosphoribosylaminoimidazole carboxylase PurE protein
MAGRVAILMGSASDLDHVGKIVAQLDALGVPSSRRVASAHKSVHHLLAALDELNGADEPIVIIAVAGRSNALAGMADANVTYPVITCPPASSAFGGADIFSSLRMPGGVAPMVILEPAAAALAAAKILALSDAGLRQRVAAYQKGLTDEIVAADQSLNG